MNPRPGVRRLLLRPARQPSPDDEQQWELIDPWGAGDRPVAAAVTRREDGVVLLLDVGVEDDAPPESVHCLVEQLVATLRRTDASVVWACPKDPHVRAELSAAGFVPLADPDAAHLALDLG